MFGKMFFDVLGASLFYALFHVFFQGSADAFLVFWGASLLFSVMGTLFSGYLIFIVFVTVVFMRFRSDVRGLNFLLFVSGSSYIVLSWMLAGGNEVVSPLALGALAGGLAFFVYAKNTIKLDI